MPNVTSLVTSCLTLLYRVYVDFEGSLSTHSHSEKTLSILLTCESYEFLHVNFVAPNKVYRHTLRGVQSRTHGDDSMTNQPPWTRIVMPGIE